MKKICSEKIGYFIIAIIVLSIPCIWTKGPWYAPDSAEYVNMYAYLPALYPFFLRVLRVLVGDNLFVYVAIFLQTLFAAWIVVDLSLLLCDVFEARNVKHIIFILLLLTYYKVMLTGISCNLWILTEGLSYSLFYVFVYYSVIFLKENRYLTYIKLIISIVLLILCRKQFILCIGMAGLYIGFLLLKKKIKSRKTVNLIIITLVGIILASVIQNEYEKIADRTNIKTFNQLSLGTHLFYYSEPEDVSGIEDESEKELFVKIRKKMVESDLGYKGTHEGWLVGVKSYVDSFNPLYSILASEIREYVRERGVYEAAEVDEIASQVLERQIYALRLHFVKWGWDSIKQFPVTMVKIVAHYYEPLRECCIIFMMMAYIFYIGINILLLVWTKKIQPENIFCLFQIIFTFVNVIVTEMLIRSIMRYVAYSFGLFYISGLLVVLALFKVRSKSRVLIYEKDRKVKH